MVVKIAANHGDKGIGVKSLFIGREKEINEIIEDNLDIYSSAGMN
ncbi:MAG TPA: hypothetical protein VI278_03135 [Nitrososphaeraceae archaeon]